LSCFRYLKREKNDVRLGNKRVTENHVFNRNYTCCDYWVYWKKIYTIQNDKKKLPTSIVIKTNSPNKGSSSLVIHENENSEKEKQINHYLKVSSATLGLTAITTLFYPALVPLSIFAIIYSTLPILKLVFELFLKHGG